MEGVNETKLGIPGDVYSSSVLAVNEGDAATIHFYNLDPSDRHTFTMAAPYSINKDVGSLENATITFKASDPGVYRFYCTYHQPTMSGQSNCSSASYCREVYSSKQCLIKIINPKR